MGDEFLRGRGIVYVSETLFFFFWSLCIKVGRGV